MWQARSLYSAALAAVPAFLMVFAAQAGTGGGMPDRIIIDNDDPGFAVVDGKWNRSTRDQGFEGSCYLWSRGTEPWPSEGKRTSGLEFVRWLADLPRDGRYNVYAKWVASRSDDRATDAPYCIMHRDGETVVRVSQADLSLSGKWNPLGTFDFTKGAKAAVILNTNADNTVVADAVMFEYAGEPSPPPATREEAQPTAKGAGSPLVFFDDFSGGLGKWVFEGPGTAQIRDGALYVKPLPMPGTMAWIATKAPAAFRLEFDMRPISASGFWLVFFCADTLDGKMFDPVQPPREGVFDRYTRNDGLRCYHTSYRRNLAGDCNLRKNPGMDLIASTPDLGTLETGVTHHVVLTYDKGRVTLAVDGRPFVDYTDSKSPYGAGYIALRNVYDCETLYDNVAVYDISAPD